MDREKSGQIAQTGPKAADALVLESRAGALNTAALAVRNGAGPVLVTGEPGVGKTWLCRQLAARAGAGWRWAQIDLTPTTTPTSFFRSVGYRAGIDRGDLNADAPRSLDQWLLEQAADGWCWGLIVDEAHTAPAIVLDELRILANRVGEPGALGAIVIAGQTRLVSRLATQPLSALANRLAAHLHLRPIDADEAYALLSARWPGRGWTIELVDNLHRDASGNPMALVRLASSHVPARQTEPTAERTTAPIAPATRAPAADAPVAPSPAFSPPIVPAAPVAQSATASAPVALAPLLGPSKPPLREEEGLIEVGWEPPAAEMTLETSHATGLRSERAAAATGGEETLDDHYTALQAWNEWKTNQPAAADPAAKPVRTELTGAAEDELKADGALPGLPQPHVWAEGPERFGPYSQLFSRLRHSKGQD